MNFFFLLSQEIGQTSGGSNDIPTRLAPRRTPILCRQSQIKILLKKGKKVHEGGLGQNSQKTKQKQKRNIKLKENSRHKKKHMSTGT